MENYNQWGNTINYVGAPAYAKLFRSVFIWMALALAATGLTASYVANYLVLHPDMFSQNMFLVLAIAEVALVFFLSARIHKMSFATAGIMFALYSVLNGATMSILFLVYTASSIASTFFVTAGTFGVMALIGTTTKMDLTKFGSIFTMALIGLIIATVVNIFWANSILYWAITYIGVLLFVGLTAYDAQRIKNMLQMYGTEENDMTQKIALMGSLTLYLDFINLFIYLLRILGSRRD
ncbi:MAG: Bax inhibitor-1/YccA family protein [Bacteroidales bacterium]|nr:Bax inhibitor-1/YccA family protein [Bacteroidales bacterium]